MVPVNIVVDALANNVVTRDASFIGDFRTEDDSFKKLFADDQEGADI
ncbi:hypothetical protein CASFOL_009016 [Castilleja foliolosa]|uniref:Uncharacterized protein n=1 Tax=Castilleja foliolosa TaxID=1961234 RepID=A0ABD3E0Y9_9LAMI